MPLESFRLKAGLIQSSQRGSHAQSLDKVSELYDIQLDDNIIIDTIYEYRK